MGQIERLIQNYDTRVSLPWERNLAGPQRVWFAVHSKLEERRLRRRLEEFDISTKRAKHGWLTIDLTDAVAQWLSHHEYRLQTPESASWDAEFRRSFNRIVNDDARQQRQTIESERQLLAEPDPVAPLCDKLTQVLREKLTAHHSCYQQLHQEGLIALKKTDAWSKLTHEQRQSILAQNGLVAVPGIKVGTEAEIIASLEGISLEMWQANCDALPQRFQKAQRDAAKLIEPKVVYVTLLSATIHNEAELEAVCRAKAGKT